MMDGEDLHNAILESPDDDTPRLIYADWLDEHGDCDRAQFIRVQIEKFRRFGNLQPMDSPEYISLLAQEKRLFSLNFERWLEPFRKRGEPFQSRDTFARYQRGFIHEVWMRAKTFLSRAKILFRKVPCQHLKLTQASLAEMEFVIHSPYLSRLTVLDISPIEMNDQMVNLVSTSPAIHRLKKLIINYHKFSDVTFDRFLHDSRDWSETCLQIAYYYPITSFPRIQKQHCPNVILDLGRDVFAVPPESAS
jgi:uncharacterized protein (TIGR02996 family)